MKPEAIQKIIDQANAVAGATVTLASVEKATMSFAGRDYIRDGKGAWLEIPQLLERDPPLQAPYKLQTLKGLVDYLKADVDGTKAAKAVVHVESPTYVSVVGPTVGYKKLRPVFAQVAIADAKQPFGEAQNLETFMVWLRSRFIPTYDSESLIKALSGVKDGQVKNVVDTGLTQEVSVKVGVDMTDRESVKNPVLLQPYRTFREVEQPKSEFVVRLASGDPLPGVTLHEADGGTWKVEAVLKVVTFLREALGTDWVVIS